MSPLYLIDGLRTPFCRAGTSLKHLDAVELGRIAVSALLTKTGIDPQVIDETVIGCVGQPPHAQNIARVIAVRAGLPVEKPAMTVHRNCASGLEAAATAFDKHASNHGDVFVVGGAESMSRMPLYFSQRTAEKFGALAKAKTFGDKFNVWSSFRFADFKPVIGLKLGLSCVLSGLGMGETAEVLAREFGISREAQDAFALASHQKAAKAASIVSETEITPVTGKEVVNADNGIRADSSLDKLAKLPPMFDRDTGSVTAGNSSQITDGAVALLVAGEAKMSLLGWKPLARIVDYVATGVDPKRMGLGPVTAIAALLRRTGLSLQDIDIIEINEAFAVQVLAVMKGLSDKDAARRCGLDEPVGAIDEAKLNPRGGAIAIGHPVGASGARLLLSAANQLRAGGLKRAIVSLCVGGGQGEAMLIEAV